MRTAVAGSAPCSTATSPTGSQRSLTPPGLRASTKNSSVGAPSARGGGPESAAGLSGEGRLGALGLPKPRLRAAGGGGPRRAPRGARAAALRRPPRAAAALASRGRPGAPPPIALQLTQALRPLLTVPPPRSSSCSPASPGASRSAGSPSVTSPSSRARTRRQPCACTRALSSSPPAPTLSTSSSPCRASAGARRGWSWATGCSAARSGRGWAARP
mmetsp:Transcript_27211/g.92891  ORF Transcript_27211/g.92891 Transcript_27211/m.92891 type:complete len:216 (-) Transcript_27211:193-840(-)